MERPGITFGL